MRLIDAHALINEINEMWKIHPAGLENRKILSFEAVIDLIGAAPTIDRLSIIMDGKRNREEEIRELILILYHNMPEISIKKLEKVAENMVKWDEVYVLPAIRDYGAEGPPGPRGNPKDEATEEIKPVIYAHWNEDGRCTNCGEHAPFWAMASTYYESKYCHGCGARMTNFAGDINVGSKEPIPRGHENG